MTRTSKAFLQADHQQNLSLLKIYTLYRVVISVVLLAIFLFEPFDHVFFGRANHQLFFYGIALYLIINLITLIVVLPKSKQLSNQQLFLTFFVDVMVIIFLMDSSGGVSSGLELLLVVIVAASSIMLMPQLALLMAALASLGVLADTVNLIIHDSINMSSFISAGLIGIILFLTSFFIQNLAARIRGSQLLAEQRAEDVTKLQQLNQQIVQRMRTGILVCESTGKVLLANSAAGELLGDATLTRVSNIVPHRISDPLLQQLRTWQVSPQFRLPPFHVQESDRELLVNFSSISESPEAGTLIFLEDNRRLIQAAQQMKLASLGRLTASIAHEIRNPLGAISHASQLLAESEQLNADDRRLCDIIQNHSARMNKVIENVLQLSSRNAPNPERVLLSQWLQQFIEEFTSRDDRQGAIELQTDDSPHETIVDSSQLNQVITNLCHNGLRYSLKQTGEAKIVFKLYDHAITRLPILDIIDFGPGVPGDAIEHIFEPFYTTDPRGSGLGLYISRELCEANEARLDYIHTESGGGCFRISFPHPDRRLRPD